MRFPTLNLTEILESAASGDSAARAELIEVAYQDLKQLAQARMRNERLDHTLTATALVSEVSLKLLKDSHVALTTGKEFSPTYPPRCVIFSSTMLGPRRRKNAAASCRSLPLTKRSWPAKPKARNSSRSMMRCKS